MTITSAMERLASAFCCCLADCKAALRARCDAVGSKHNDNPVIVRILSGSFQSYWELFFLFHCLFDQMHVLSRCGHPERLMAGLGQWESKPIDLAMIRSADAGDSSELASLYNHYVLESTSTFEEYPVEPAVMAQRVAAVQDLNLPWRVAEQDGALAGYAYANRWNPRTAYRHTVEISIYVSPECAQKGLGSTLYTQLFDDLQSLPVQQVMAMITLPNPLSIALHEKFGMSKVAHLSRVGFKFGKWLDVGYWQCSLARPV